LPSPFTAREIYQADWAGLANKDEVAVMGTFNSGCAKIELPVLNQDKRLVGIVALGDLATATGDERMKGLIAGIVSIVIVAAVTSMGISLKDFFTSVAGTTRVSCPSFRAASATQNASAHVSTMTRLAGRPGRVHRPVRWRRHGGDRAARASERHG